MQPLNYLKHISLAILLVTLTTTMSPAVSALTFTEKESNTTPSLPSPQEIAPGQATSTYLDPSGYTIAPEIVVDSTTQTFTWSPVVGASKYALYVRNLDTNALMVMEENLTTTSYATSTLSAGYHYKWSVRAKDSQGRGGWLSDGYYFKVKEGVAETPRVGDERYIDLYVLDENDDPIIDTQMLAVADVSCAVINLCIAAGPIDMKTDINGKIRFYYDKFKVKGIYVDISNPNASSSNLLFGTSTNNVYVLNMDNSGRPKVLYQGFEARDTSEFMEGFRDYMTMEKSLESLGVGLTFGAAVGTITGLAENTAFGTALLNKVKVIINNPALRRGGATIIFVAVMYLEYSQLYNPDTNYYKCMAHTTLYDNDLKKYKTDSYYCGKLLGQIVSLALETGGLVIGAKMTTYAIERYAYARTLAAEVYVADSTVPIIKTSNKEIVGDEVFDITTQAGITNATAAETREITKIVQKVLPNISIEEAENIAQDKVLLTLVKRTPQQLIDGKALETRLTQIFKNVDSAEFKSLANSMNVTPDFLASLQSLEQLQVFLPREGWVVLDNVWVRTIKDEITNVKTFDLYINETKLNLTTALSERQTQFLDALSSGVKQFTTRSVKPEIAEVIPRNSLVTIKSFVKTMSNGSVNGPLLTVKLY